MGNLIYYRYINSAIVAPDAFDIVDVGPQHALTNDQRRNLGSIAKILQFAAANKGVKNELINDVRLRQAGIDCFQYFVQLLKKKVVGCGFISN